MRSRDGGIRDLSKWRISAMLMLTGLALVAGSVLAQTQGDQQQQQQPAQQNPKQPIKIDPAYSKVANQTGGQVYVIDRDKVNDLAKIMGMTSHANQEDLLVVNDKLEGQERSYEAAVDGDMALLVVSITGTKDFEVHRPSGGAVGRTENVVQYVEVANGGIYQIQNPEPGKWTAVLRGSGEVSVRVNAVRAKESAGGGGGVQFDRFEFVEVGGRIGHEGMFQIQGFPLAGREADVEADLDGEISNVHFEFRSPGGEVLNSFKLQKVPGDEQEYSGKVMVPEAPFLVYAVGVDMRGNRFQRLRSGQVNPQTFRVSAPRYWELEGSEESACEVEVTNYGAAGSFRVTTVDPRRLLKEVAPQTFDLGANGSVKVKLTLQAPADPKVAGESLMVLVQRVNSEQNNFALIETTVVRK